jgi:NTP pyrophosphatase (non-canonical NTP hydrolase)
MTIVGRNTFSGTTEVPNSMHRIVQATHSTFSVPELMSKDCQMLCAAMGVAGEAGEVCDMIKKWFEQGREVDKDKLLLELADVSYYVQLMLIALDKTEQEMVDALANKLSKRYPNGFSTEASKNRKG